MAAGLLQVKEGDKASLLNLSFFYWKMRSHWEAFDRCTNPQGRPRGTNPAFPIHVQRLFLCLIVGIKHNTKLAAKISCDSPDCSGHVMRNFWTEHQKSSDYIQKEEAEKFCFGHSSMKAQHKCKKSSQAWTSPEEQNGQEKGLRLLSEQFSISGRKTEIQIFCEDVTKLWDWSGWHLTDGGDVGDVETDITRSARSRRVRTYLPETTICAQPIPSSHIQYWKW